MKENITIINYLEKVHKANRPDDFNNLLSIQIKLNGLDKENRLLRELVESSNARNIKMEAKVRISESKALSLKSGVSILEEENERLKQQVNELTKNLDI